MVKINIGENEKQQRLDKFLKKYLTEAPLSYIYKAVRKDVKVNGKRKKNDYVLEEGDEISLYISEEDLNKFHKQRKQTRVKKQFAVAYEDENLLIAEKPAGLLTHGDGKEKTNHLANQVISYLIAEGSYDPRAEKTFVPAPVNRIDRNTAGLVIFAKNYDTLKAMNAVIRSHEAVKKDYLTIAVGEIREPMHLTGHMQKDEARNLVSLVNRSNAKGAEDGKFMETDVTPLETAGGYTLAQVRIHTGRTHQIRVQMAEAGHPLIGDAKYGDPAINRKIGKQFGLTTQLLLAWRLTFQDMPEQLAYLNGKVCEAKMPVKFKKIKETLFGEKR